MFIKSIVLSAFSPGSMENEKYFLSAIKAINKYDINLIEYYYKGNDKQKIKEHLNNYGLKSIYLGAMAAKQNNLNLASLNKQVRDKSIREMKKCIDDAYFYDSQSILVNSGKRPVNAEDENIAYECLKKSLSILLEYIEEEAKDYKLKLTLEPGDTDVDSFSLIGHTDLAIKLVRELLEKYDNVGLTMDTSHLIQLDENPIDSIKKAFFYCNHIHLANCIIRDKTHELYGDKHPEFGIEGGEINLQKLKNILKSIKEIYEGSELIYGLEIICRKNKKEEIDCVKNTMNGMSWFYK